MIEEILPHLKAGGKDYSSNLVVFPGKRPSHFLRKALAQKIKNSFIPPVIYSMDEFVDHRYESLQTRKKIETIDAVVILYEIHKKALRPLGGEAFLSPDKFFSVGLKIYRDLEELTIEDVQPARVKQIELFTGEVIPEQTLARLQSLSFFYENFYKAIGEKGLSTRSVRYREVSKTIDESGLSCYGQVIFAGFFALTKCEKVLFGRLLQKENTLFIFQNATGLKEKLSDLGIVTDRMEENPVEPVIRFYSSPDAHGQVYALSKVISSRPALKQGNRGEGFNETTAVVLPSAEILLPLLRQGLPMLSEDSYNISIGYPLHRTPIFGFLNNLMELVLSMDDDRVYIPDYLKFVLHPYTKNIYCGSSAEITRIMFHAIEEKLTENRTKTFVTLSEIENDEDIISHILDRLPEGDRRLSKRKIREHLTSVHDNTIKKFLSFEKIEDFSAQCTELLTYIFNNSTARQHPLFFPFSESFLKAMETVSQSLMKNYAFTETSSYFTFFRRYIMNEYTPFEGTPLRGLQILGFLETRNIRFDTVYILDLNEDTMPDTRKEDTLLPLKARQILGLPTYLDRDKLSAYYFETLLKGSKEAHLFFIENDKKERSRFVEQVLWEKQKKDRTTDPKRYLQFVQYKIRLDNPVPGEIAKSVRIAEFLRNFRYSATSLDTYLACQLKFYYTFLLRLDRKEEISGDIERVDIGKFVHRALSEYFRRRKNRLLKESDIDIKEMNNLIDKMFGDEYGNNPAGSVYLLRHQIKNHLRDFLEKYYIPAIRNQPLMFVDIEKDIHIAANSFQLRGRLDSIEKRGSKTYIIDYKTGSNSNRLRIKPERLVLDDRESWNESIGSLQLPFYLLLYSRKTNTKIRDLNGLFLLLGRSFINHEIEIPLFKDGNGEETYEILEAVIFGLLNEIVNPSYPFKPASDKKASCPSCNFRYICGTQWIVK
jgi:CRISPR/Cas system-associated exonuclease Cas4 (RecB family)